MASAAIELEPAGEQRGDRCETYSSFLSSSERRPWVAAWKAAACSALMRCMAAVDAHRTAGVDVWASACRHSFEGEECGNEVDRGSVAGIGLIVPSGDSAELLDPLEGVLDQVTPLVHLGVVKDRRFAIRLRRDDGDGASFIQYGSQGVVVEGLVGDESVEIDARDQRLHADAVVTLSRQQDKARHIAQRIDESDDLGGQPAARPADGPILSPPFAPAPCR